MTWFSVGLPLILQLIVPGALLLWLAGSRHAAWGRRSAVAALCAAYVVAIAIAGLWLVLPWWLPLVYLALFVWLVVGRDTGRAAASPARSRGHRVVTAAAGALAVALVGIIGLAVIARRPPSPPAELAFPLRGGTYLVVNGGSQALVNAHLGTLEGERFAAYRGQSYGVDLVRVDRLGLRVHGLLPADPARYFIFGDPVMAPCGGQIVAAEDGADDMPPPQADRSHMAGNHVIVGCDGLWVVLGHLRRGSVAVQAGQTVAAGQVVGVVGNSGNTGEPHLHLHAQRPGSPAAPLSGDPVPVRLDGRYLVRNDRVAPRSAGF
jgi:hypothetical protein